MLAGLTALTLAAAFTGAAIYILVAEQPARLHLDDRSLIAEWQASYKRAAPMQASLAAVSFILGLIAWWQSGALAFALGAALVILPWPWTLAIMMPTNNALTAMKPSDAGSPARTLVLKWGNLHMARAVLGALATVAFLWASLG
jgi:hypothetical protein